MGFSQGLTVTPSSVIGKAVDAVLCGQNFKAYCSKIKRMGKVDFALACETLKYLSVIKQLYADINIDPFALEVNTGVLFTMTYETLFGRKKISSGGTVKRILQEHVDHLKAALDKLMRSMEFEKFEELIPRDIADACSLPRYIRINTLKISLDEGIQQIKIISNDLARQDSIIPSLMAMPAKASLCIGGQHPLVKEGIFILQDKASCFPSQILYDYWQGGDVIDACAAPGNKTSHLAAQIYTSTNYKSETIFAFDRDLQRAALLSRRLALMCPDKVVVKNMDFLQIDHASEQFKNVSSILLDPSCSGSSYFHLM